MAAEHDASLRSEKRLEVQQRRFRVEDSHVVNLDIDGRGTALFGVFDGHAGKEVAAFCAKHVASVLASHGTLLLCGDVHAALSQTYLSLDAMMADPVHQAELYCLRKDVPTDVALPALAEAAAAAAADVGTGGMAWQQAVEVGGGGQHQQQQKRAADEAEAAGGSMQLESGGDGGSGSSKRRAAAAAHHPAAGAPSTDQGPRDDSVHRRRHHSSSSSASESHRNKHMHQSADHQQAALLAEQLEGEVQRYGRFDGHGQYLGPRAGAAATVAVIQGSEIFAANAGDSRCVLAEGGVAVPLTRDHKPTDPQEAARIYRAGDFVARGRVRGSLAMSRALGDAKYKDRRGLPPGEQPVTSQPDTTEHHLTPGGSGGTASGGRGGLDTCQYCDTFVMLACDGLWDIMSNQQAVTYVSDRLRRGMPPSAVLVDLLNEALAPDSSTPPSYDNITVMLLVVKELPPSPPAAAGAACGAVH